MIKCLPHPTWKHTVFGFIGCPTWFCEHNSCGSGTPPLCCGTGGAAALFGGPVHWPESDPSSGAMIPPSSPSAQQTKWLRRMYRICEMCVFVIEKITFQMFWSNVFCLFSLSQKENSGWLWVHYQSLVFVTCFLWTVCVSWCHNWLGSVWGILKKRVWIGV